MGLPDYPSVKTCHGISWSLIIVILTLISPVGASDSGARVQFAGENGDVFGWQKESLASPKGGPEFASSAFVHPLATPSGFVCTNIQPDDHLHHLGLWWPWKFIEVDGKKVNTWEIQQGQGAHVARGVKEVSRTKEAAVWEVRNETVVKRKDAEPKVVIQETGTIALTMRGDATVLDIALDQKTVGGPVVIGKNHYSGFSWRGPESWNKDNSTMLSSGGKGRDDANGTPARWLVVQGASPKGPVSVLILSKAEKLAGEPEKLRVWDSRNHNGAPFVNFNPVYGKPLPLDDAHPSVSKRAYRVIAADRAVDAAEAEAEWKKWVGQ